MAARRSSSGGHGAARPTGQPVDRLSDRLPTTRLAVPRAPPVATSPESSKTGAVNFHKIAISSEWLQTKIIRFFYSCHGKFFVMN
jgi:hypothetical protein